MTTKNIPLLWATLETIKLHPEQHDQSVWVEPTDEPCGTVMCYAGHAALLAGAKFDKQIYWDSDEWNLNFETGEHVYESDMYADGDWWGDRLEGFGHVEDYAALKLGLSKEERFWMFYHARTVEQLEEAVEKFAQGYSIVNGEFVKE